MNLEKLERDLWEAADNLRANSKLTAAQYAMPVLGLIFLRHAYNRFLAVKAELEPTLPKRAGKPRDLVPGDFIGKAAIYLPPTAYYEHLLAQPEGPQLAEAVVTAMEQIEVYNATLAGILPKAYRGFEPRLLMDLLKTFNRDSLKKASGDVFGKIYEYFLNKFAQTGAQEGGEFFTPPSLVRLIVNIIEPDRGTVFDPACGSGGMFVQTGHFIELQRHAKPHQRVVFHGQEKAETNAHLARMNLAVHGLEGDIRIANSFYDEQPELINRCDFVMANPPFNVDGVNTDQVKKQVGQWDDEAEAAGTPQRPEAGKRLPFGLPGTNAKTKAISNANSLWVQYFYAYLNASGRAGFVMASSASDAGNKDKDIRRRLVSTGHVDTMVAIGPKFFYTRSLPCTLWFFDKGKPRQAPAHACNSQDRVLMLDARNVYHVESARHHRFTEEQLANLTAIVWLHRGEDHKFRELVASYQSTARKHLGQLESILAERRSALSAALAQAESFARKATPEELNRKRKDDDETGTPISAEQLAEFATSVQTLQADIATGDAELAALLQATDLERATAARPHDALALTEQTAGQDRLEALTDPLRAAIKRIEGDHKACGRLLENAEKTLNAKQSAAWENKQARDLRRALAPADDVWLKAHDDQPTPHDAALETLKTALHFIAQSHWLLHRFPAARYADVAGLCKSVTRAEIEKADWSLTPGRYVGVSTDNDEDLENFSEALKDIYEELDSLEQERVGLYSKIRASLGALF
jgi:type I restriction enzyme M protein